MKNESMRLKETLNTMSLVGYIDPIEDKRELDIICKKLDRLELGLVYTDKLDNIFRHILQHNSKALLNEVIEFMFYLIKINEGQRERIVEYIDLVDKLINIHMICWDNDFYILLKIFQNIQYYRNECMNMDFIMMELYKQKIYRVSIKGDIILDNRYRKMEVVTSNGYNYMRFDNENRLVGMIVMVDGIAGSYDSDMIKNRFDAYTLVNNIGIDNIDLIVTAINDDNIERLIEMRLT